MGRLTIASVAVLSGLLLSCDRPAATAEKAASTSETEQPETIATIWPAGLNVLGDGYPNPGDPCRRLGESAATVNYLDDSAQLVGCPGTAAEAASASLVSARGGRVVGSVDGVVTLISMPLGDTNAGLSVTNKNEGSSAK